MLWGKSTQCISVSVSISCLPCLRYTFTLCFLGLLQQITPNKSPQRLKTTEMCSLTALESRSPKPRCRHSHSPSTGSREESFFVFFQLLVAPSNPWHSLACGSITHHCLCRDSDCCFPVCISVFSSYKETFLWVKGPS